MASLLYVGVVHLERPAVSGPTTAKRNASLSAFIREENPENSFPTGHEGLFTYMNIHTGLQALMAHPDRTKITEQL